MLVVMLMLRLRALLVTFALMTVLLGTADAESSSDYSAAFATGLDDLPAGLDEEDFINALEAAKNGDAWNFQLNAAYSPLAGIPFIQLAPGMAIFFGDSVDEAYLINGQCTSGHVLGNSAAWYKFTTAGHCGDVGDDVFFLSIPYIIAVGEKSYEFLPGCTNCPFSYDYGEIEIDQPFNLLINPTPAALPPAEIMCSGVPFTEDYFWVGATGFVSELHRGRTLTVSPASNLASGTFLLTPGANDRAVVGGDSGSPVVVCGSNGYERVGIMTHRSPSGSHSGGSLF